LPVGGHFRGGHAEPSSSWSRARSAEGARARLCTATSGVVRIAEGRRGKGSWVVTSVADDGHRRGDTVRTIQRLALADVKGSSFPAMRSSVERQGPPRPEELLEDPRAGARDPGKLPRGRKVPEKGVSRPGACRSTTSTVELDSSVRWKTRRSRRAGNARGPRDFFGPGERVRREGLGRRQTANSMQKGQGRRPKVAELMGIHERGVAGGPDFVAVWPGVVPGDDPGGCSPKAAIESRSDGFCSAQGEHHPIAADPAEAMEVYARSETKGGAPENYQPLEYYSSEADAAEWGRPAISGDYIPGSRGEGCNRPHEPRSEPASRDRAKAGRVIPAWRRVGFG